MLFRSSRLNSCVVALCLHSLDLCLLLLADGRIHAEEVLRSLFLHLELVDTDDDACTGLNIHLPLVSAVLDLLLDVALLDRRNSAAEIINLLDFISKVLNL